MGLRLRASIRTIPFVLTIAALIGQDIQPQAVRQAHVRAVAGESPSIETGPSFPIAIDSARVTPTLEFPIRAERDRSGEVHMIVPPATPPGEYEVELAGRGPDGRTTSTVVPLTVAQLTVQKSATGRTPVILSRAE